MTIETEDGRKDDGGRFQRGHRGLSNFRRGQARAGGCKQIWADAGDEWMHLELFRSSLLDLEHTFIVYGTVMEGTANRIAAEKLQLAIVGQWEHLVVPIRADNTVSDEDLRVTM